MHHIVTVSAERNRENMFLYLFVGAIMLVGQVADALATPFTGRESDKSAAMCGRYGKRKGGQ